MTTATAVRRAVVYARISEDPTGGAAGVARQEGDSLAFCEARGWPVVEVLIDNDISASRYSRKRRPGWARVLELLDADLADAIVAWDLDRMLRQPRELEDLIDRAEKGLTVLTLQGQLDLSTADGRAMARVMVAMAAKASDDTSRRVRRAKQSKAERGEVFSGVKAFGWTDNGATIVEHEAAAIRDAASRVLAGEGTTAIAREWQAKGLKPPRGARGWSTTTVRAVLSSPRNAALMQYRGEIIGAANWPAILDAETFRALQRLFADPARARAPRRRGTFTAVFRCGICGHSLTKDTTSGRTIWRCRPTPGTDRCGKLSITASYIEPVVVEALMVAADTGELAARVRAPEGEADQQARLAELDKLEARKAELAEMFAAGEISRAEWLTARKPLEEAYAALDAAVATQRQVTALDSYMTGPGVLRAAWEEASEDVRRTMLLSAFERVVVHPRSPERSDPVSRIDLVWRF